MDTEFELQWPKKGKTKNWHDCFEMNSMFWTSVHCFFFPTCHALKAWFELSRVKLYWNDLKGNKNYFELRVGLSYRGFELLRVKLQCMKEIPGKLTLVWASSKFEFIQRIWVIGCQLHYHFRSSTPWKATDLPLSPSPCTISWKKIQFNFIFYL